MKIKNAEKYFYSSLEKQPLEMFSAGKLYNSYKFFGAHRINCDGYEAVRFLVWAPHAASVCLVGEFNDWDQTGYPLKKISHNGVWEISVFNVKVYDSYKYRIVTPYGEVFYKADPYGFHMEERPKSASKYFDIENYSWKDRKWRESLKKRDSYVRPISIYEVNLLSWKKKKDGKQYSYKDLAEELVPYVKEMGFTHIEIMPIMEHPYDGSWGYQVTGYFAPTSRFGTPTDFMYFIDCCHQNDIGVILDWVPVHYCKDAHGLCHFDGEDCFESSDRGRAENEQWGTVNFDYGKTEVRNFLISNAIYWHEKYHIDGMRIDAVAYMLYLNFSGKDIRNQYGGYEHIEAVEFIKELNSAVFLRYPKTLMMAEESTAWPLVTSPTDVGGLGFNYKWNMGWMNDILEYMEQDSLFRKGNQNALTFSITYAFSENYVLPLSHDEVVHGKKSLLSKMPGTYKEKFANLRLLYAYMYAHPGKKLLFMGGEFGQFIEWNEWQGLDWHLLDYESHGKMREFVKNLNKFYRREPCLYELDTTYDGFEWIEHENHQESIIAFERKGSEGDKLIVVFNFTPIERKRYPIGVDKLGSYKVVLNSNLIKYGGDSRSMSVYKAKILEMHNKPYAIRLTIPPLSGVFLKYKGNE
ncbi:1,4-alpha-glucan branching enzyme [Alkalibaculum bacchi]|uniref:1,4-alpha-glucan branching enzyme GlgB n=1 Tax=Alkalibaculum bacchi TaxID=645887 RepID=A0A366IFU6_9FIRM|nr:1,4-alpha-glucan branching protein GlgB [Alkalibaculum bacchi]RBP70216.1 1,4-alpha-glucan branching enzyme [Alkalibaculum bacchi]